MATSGQKRVAAGGMVAHPSLIHDHHRSDATAGTSTVILIGPSVRAAAEMVRTFARQTRSIVGVDAFGDVDTRRFCNQWFEIDTFKLGDAGLRPSRQPDAAKSRYEIHVVGGLNAASSSQDPVIRQAITCLERDTPAIDELGYWSNGTRIATPPTFAAPPTNQHRTPLRKSLLRKSLRSSGGLGVRMWHPSDPTDSELVVLQRRIFGRSISVAAYAHANHSVVLLGCCRSFKRGGSVTPFAYAGNAGPYPIPHNIRDCVQTVADRFASDRRFRGPFNFDFVVDRDDRWWLHEINPRYSASFEIYERLNRRSILIDGPPIASIPHTGKPAVIKRIIYAEQPSTFRYETIADRYQATNLFDDRYDVRIADYPSDGTRIPAHHPTCTIIAIDRDAIVMQRGDEGDFKTTQRNTVNDP